MPIHTNKHKIPTKLGIFTCREEHNELFFKILEKVVTKNYTISCIEMHMSSSENGYFKVCYEKIHCDLKGNEEYKKSNTIMLKFKHKGPEHEGRVFDFLKMSN